MARRGFDVADAETVNEGLGLIAARPPAFSSRTKSHQGEKAASAFPKLSKPKSSSVARGRTAAGTDTPTGPTSPVPMSDSPQ